MPDKAFFTSLASLLARYGAAGHRLALRARDADELATRRRELRGELRRVIGLDTLRPAPLEPRIAERVAQGGCVRERVELTTEAGVVMPHLGSPSRRGLVRL